MKILMTGATGLIGSHLGKRLVAEGHEILVVSRGLRKPFICEIIQCDLNTQNISDTRLDQVDAVIHLMGENVGGGWWTKERKQRILESRTVTTKNLIDSFKNKNNLKVFVSAGGSGLYGDRGAEPLTENAGKGTGFLSDVCEKWEASLSGLSSFPNCRKVIMRTSMVLSSDGGALEKILIPFRLKMGGMTGSGRQWMSWIHIQDIVELYAEALIHPRFQGPINASTAMPVTNEEFSKTLAEIVGQKSLRPRVPEIVLKLALGEMSLLLLASQKIVPEKLKNLNFQYAFPDLKSALQDCVRPASSLGKSKGHSPQPPMHS